MNYELKNLMYTTSDLVHGDIMNNPYLTSNLLNILLQLMKVYNMNGSKKWNTE